MTVFPYSSTILKRSAAHFLTGKIASGILTLIILLLMVRVLAIEDYGVYVILVAGLELVLAITSLGLSWTMARYLPEFRLRASGKVLARFVWQSMAQIGLFLVIGILLLLWMLPWLLSLMELTPYTEVVKIYLLVVLLEGLGRNLQENALGPLLQQGWAQISIVVRNLVWLLLLGIVTNQGMADLHHVILAELAASALGLLLALHGLFRYLHKNRDLPGQNDWQPPAWSEMWRIARHMYFSHLITLIYSPQVFMFLIQRYLGVEATALFGFLRNLFGQILRYLPATLLFSLIRPKLVSSYVDTSSNMVEVARSANLAGKLSLFVLMPLLVFAWLVGDELLNILSAGKFNETGYYLAGLLLALIPCSQRQILGTLAVVSDKSYMSLWGSSLGILVLPLAYWQLQAVGLWSFIIAIIVSHMIYNVVLVVGLMRSTTYRPDNIGFIKLVAAALMGFVLSKQFAVAIHGWLDLFIMAMLVCVSFLLTAYFIKPFKVEERERLNRLLGREIFVW